MVADTANGMGGLVVPKVFEGLPCELSVLFGELDGTFPNHPADPIQPENLVALQKAVLDAGADIGLAFDGDADRVFLVDDRGEPVSGSTTTAIVAESMLRRAGGGTVVYNLICSKAVPEVIRENGGEPVRTRVGHSFIKQVMAETDAIFGGEHSAHYYFRDNWRADSGSIAAMVVLEALSKAGRPAVRAAPPVRALRRVGRDQHRGRRPARRDRGRRRALRRRRAGPARRSHRRPRRLVVQPAAEQHRAAAAAQPRGGRPRRVRCSHRGSAGAHPSRFVGEDVALDPQLLEILACPDDKGPLLYFEGEGALYNPRLKRRYTVRDDIPIMLVDEAETVDDAEHERLVALAAERRGHPPHVRRR